MDQALQLTFDTMYCLLLVMELYIDKKIPQKVFKECSEVKIPFLKDQLRLLDQFKPAAYSLLVRLDESSTL